MPKIAFLECALCKTQVSAEQPATVCPVCAGSFYVRYDLSDLVGTDPREVVGKAAVADPKRPWRGMWRYEAVLPSVTPVTLGEGWTPVMPSEPYGDVQGARAGDGSDDGQASGAKEAGGAFCG
jgi:threonine synthase